jgi:hypothetical protein
MLELYPFITHLTIFWLYITPHAYSNPTQVVTTGAIDTVKLMLIQ